MGDKRNYAALEWVLGEISDTLKEARQSLEAYVEDPKDETKIRFCLTHIHQVRGSLQMVEFYGASLLAEEMEQLAQAIMSQDVLNLSEAQEVLMRSLLQLPIFLEHIKSVKSDNPTHILPLLNDLRAARKENYLSETELFTPDFSSIARAVGEKHPITSNPEKLAQLLKKLREMYQFAAASVLRGIKVDENLGYIDKVFVRLEAVTRGTASHVTWLAASALNDGIRHDSIELSVAVNGILRSLAKELRILGDKAPESFNRPPNEGLLKNILYYVARSDNATKRIVFLKKRYSLSAALQGKAPGVVEEGTDLPVVDIDVVHDAGAIRSVVVALQDEMTNIKHVLEISLSGQGTTQDIKEILPALKRISDTLAVLGVGNLRKQMLEQYEVIEEITESEDFDDARLMASASKIIEVEQKLEAIAKAAGTNQDLSKVDEREVEIDEAKITVINESRAGLESAKEKIVEYISSQWDKSHLEKVDSELTVIRGALEIIPLKRPAAIIDSCTLFVKEQLLGKEEHPSWETLDTLADAIASVEYYLEHLAGDMKGDPGALLDVAEESVHNLGYQIEQTGLDPSFSRVEKDPLIESDFSTETVLESAITDAQIEAPKEELFITAPSDLGNTEEVPVSDVIDNENAGAQTEVMPIADIVADINNDISQDEVPVSNIIVDSGEPIEPVGHAEESLDAELQQQGKSETEGKPAELNSVTEDEEDEVDDEIKEIFIEEAGEVLETLKEYFPLWKESVENEDHLTVVRRAFHTLKGSGRMVGASVIGELGWSVENMLNRLIDGTVSFNSAHFFIIESVIDLVPALVKGFEDNKQKTEMNKVELYSSWANGLSEGNLIDSLVSAMNDDAGSLNVETAEARETAEIEDEDQALKEIFSQEAQTHLETATNFILEMDEAAPIYSPPTDAVQRALHTLKGSAKMAQISPIAQMAEPLEAFVKELIAYQASIDGDILQLFKDLVEYTSIGLDQIDAKADVSIPKIEQFIARTAELRDITVGHLVRQKEQSPDSVNRVDPELLSIFMAEEMKLLLEYDNILIAWQSDLDETAQPLELVNELNILEKGAQHANLPHLTQITKQLSVVLQRGTQRSIEVNDEYFNVIKSGFNAQLDMIDSVAAGQHVVPAPENITLALQALINIPEFVEPIDDNASDTINLEGRVEGSVGEYLDSAEPRRSENEESTDVICAEVEDTNAAAQFSEESELIENTEESNVTNFVADDESTENAVVDDAESVDVELDETAEDFAVDLPIVELDISYQSEEDSTTDIIENVLEEHTVELDETEQPEEEISISEISAEEELNSDQEDVSIQGSGLGESLADEQETELDTPINVAGSETETIDSFAFSADETEYESLNHGASLDENIEDIQPLEIGVEETESDDLSLQERSEEASETEEGINVSVSEITSAEDAFEPVEEQHGKAVEGFEAVSIQGLLDNIDVNDENYDQDIIEIFVEEAEELSEELDEAAASWENDWANKDSIEALKRALHTYKGGARLAGMYNLGELAHEYESYLIATQMSEVDQAFFAKVHRYQDKLLQASRAVKQFIEGGANSAIVTEINEAPETDVLEVMAATKDDVTSEYLDAEVIPAAEQQETQEPVDETNTSDDSNVLPFSAPKPREIPIDPVDAPAEFTMPTVSPGGGSQAAAVSKKSGPQEVVRVGAELLEELVNLAGETSISRSRLEQYVTDFSSSLEEMDSTILRLQEQLRRLDIETEAQVLFRQEQMAEHEEDFDPLEMDRYSALQQLSRSLIESSSDLVDLKEELGDKVRDTETLLVQQARINTNLQEGLMRSRMVPFSRMVPRLRRIVRQISGELGKNVSFELDNVEGELDRSVLERMVPPFEHMLRNAVDHGIETPEERIEADKSETGRIVLTLGREGGDVVIRLADDGRGVNLERVKEKAIERGLMIEGAQLADHDIMQFILHAGFSTAESVTQISGRGVGMDVVHSEIKQLGGSMSINSKWGHGTEFVIRLPFTLSVNRALMVQIGHDNYAVPLSSIEGIVRVSPFELEHYYDNPEARFEYANENYHVRYLGGLLNSSLRPKLEGHVLPLPVLLVRSAEHTMALHVDSLMGSREIVVKSLGQQFASVTGLSGATVMGDGSVVVILDPHALVRQDIARAILAAPIEQEELPESEENRIKTVMVVDDSVTVRKVTTRFLEREGFEVITAKDGVDALRVLQEKIPDVMLLDIEMPRMDGFEVAKNMRTTQRWKQIPIIMITSRTGDKHREHALSLGVNKYLGKPYQEDLLLNSIGELIEESGNAKK